MPEDPILKRKLFIYQELKSNTSTRTQNILSSVEVEYLYPSDNFFSFLLDNPSPSQSFKNLRNAGFKTVSEMIELADKIKIIFESEQFYNLAQSDLGNTEIINKQKIKISEIQEVIILNLIKEKRSMLTVRANHGLNLLLNTFQTNDQFVEFILSDERNLLNLKNVGKKSASEISSFLDDLKLVVSDLVNGEEVPEFVKKASSSYYLQEIFGLKKNDAEDLINIIGSTSDYIPIFQIIKKLISEDHREYSIWENCIKIFVNQTIRNLNYVSEVLQLTRERVRQLVLVHFKHLIKRISHWGFENPNLFQQYSYLFDIIDFNEIERIINESESVGFNSNFIFKVLHSLNPGKYIVLENDEGIFWKQSYVNGHIYLIPSELARVYNFELFKQDLTRIISEEVYESYTLDFFDYHMKFYYGDFIIEKIPEIILICKKILFNDFRIEVMGNSIFIDKNSHKKLPVITEEILRKYNRIMSLDELLKEVETIQPNSTRSRDYFKRKISDNDNIISLGKSSLYALKEWDDSAMKTGTIRDLVYIYLSGFNEPKSIKDITDYVIKYRQTTNVSSIYSNLLLDQTGRFVFYNIKNLKHVGLSNISYPD